MKLLLAATAALAFTAIPAQADTISNPGTGVDVGPLCGWPYQGGGCQTVFIGQSFTASTAGDLTNLQFTLRTSNLSSLQAIVYTLNGTTPGTEIWRSSAVAGSAGLLDFSPTGVALTQGQNYVAFLSTYYSAGTGSAIVSGCNVFSNPTCTTANANPSLGTVITGRAQGANLDELVFTNIVNNFADLTFSATITPSAVPEPTSWAMIIGGFGLVGGAMRRRSTKVVFA